MKIKLSEEARQLKNAYAREWRRKNPAKVDQYFTGYWERKAAEQNSSETLDEKVVRLNDEGFSLREIAAKTGINHVKVSRILKSK